jgi:Na+(H+)/acetate symporter ActP
MRGITYVQACQFWVKVVAIALPAIVLLAIVGLPGKSELFGNQLPTAPAGGLSVQLTEPTTVTFPERTRYSIDGRRHLAPAGAERTLPAGELEIPAGEAVPMASGTTDEVGAVWSKPVTSHSSTSSPLFVYSLLLATFLGTMGLPHILVRFHTNPDGTAARRTTVNVLGLLGLFYTFPVIYGLLGRVLTPGLYVTGNTDSVVLKLPEAAWPGLGGQILAGITAAGAFAAFMSTSSGLLVSLAGTISYDVWPSFSRRRDPTHEIRRRRFRLAAVGAIVLPLGLSLFAENIQIGVLVGWAFAIAASTFCPLFVLGIWWRRLTARGAALGMAVGATIAFAAIFTELAVGPQEGPLGALLSQPALVSVPAAFAAMILTSRFAGGTVLDWGPHMRALHTPEGLRIEGFAVAGPRTTA